MIDEVVESYLISNNKIIQVSEADAFSLGSSETIYEVIRVMSGVPLFLERHMERLEASAKLINCSIEPIIAALGEGIHELIKLNNSPDKNIKIIAYNFKNHTPDYMLYFLKSSYPSFDEYKKGVHSILINVERDNPNAKIVNFDFKKKIAEALSEAKAYEALLVNSENEITEGSRSNVFFIKDSKVYTAPKESVLIGITRVCVFELCEKLGIKIIEKSININNLRELDGLFMTGTSPKLLPISTIGDMHLSSTENPVIKSLMKGYDDMLQAYIKERTDK